jgi:hypothetical protein
MHHRRALALLVSLALLGCGSVPPSSATRVKDLPQADPTTEPLPEEGLPSASRSPACLYWISEADGSVWRSTIDGRQKELVVDCRAINAGRLTGGVSLTGSPGRNSYLALTSVPRSGYTLVDAAPKEREDSTVQLVGMELGGRVRTLKAPYSFGSKPSPWTMTAKYKLVRNLDRDHSFLDQIKMTSSQGMRAEYTFARLEGKLIALLDGGFGIIQDGNSIILWSLVDDRKYLIAKGWHPEVWPRELRQPQRFKPIATVVKNRKKLTYTMRDPRDLFRTPN